LLGYSQEELLSKTVSEINPAMSVENWRIKWEQLRLNGSLSYEGIFITKDGRRVPVDITLNYLALEGEECGYAFARDITERKQAEARLLESEQHFRDLLSNIKQVAVIIDRQGNISFCNNFLLELTGWQHEEVIGQKWFDIFLPDKICEQVKAIFEEAIQLGTAPAQYENAIVTRQGQQRLIVWSNTVLRNENGQIIGVASLGNDVTEQKKLQAQLTQSRKMESVGNLAGGVAHEFNNMLNVILGYTELSLEKTVPSSSLHHQLLQIQVAAKRSEKFTKQLLGYARKQQIYPKIINLNVTIEQEMLQMLRKVIGDNIDLNWKPKSNLWSVKIDSCQINQLLANLCANARDAITGIGKVTIETDNVYLDEFYCENHPGAAMGEQVLLTVSDDGRGIDKDHINNVFEPFFTTKSFGPNAGLGLATVYGIVKQNNGYISVSSELGQGTTFKIYLPRHTDHIEVV